MRLPFERSPVGLPARDAVGADGQITAEGILPRDAQMLLINDQRTELMQMLVLALNRDEARWREWSCCSTRNK